MIKIILFVMTLQHVDLKPPKNALVNLPAFCFELHASIPAGQPGSFLPATFCKSCAPGNGGAAFIMMMMMIVKLLQCRP